MGTRADSRLQQETRNPDRVATKLEDEGFITDRRAFVLLAVERGLTDQLKTGEFILRKSMTPDELVTALLNPPPDPFVQIDLRTGLRLEQITGVRQRETTPINVMRSV